MWIKYYTYMVPGKIINYFFQVVVPQILDYFKENKEVIPNYLILEILRKDKQYQEQIEKILELSKEENKKEENKKEERKI